MKNSFLSKSFFALSLILGQIFRYLREGFRRKQGILRLKTCLRLYYNHLQKFCESLKEYDAMDNLEGERIQSLIKTTHDAHRILSPDSEFTYSILIPVYKPKPDFFRKALQAALNQSAPNMEVLVGFDGPQPQEVYDVVQELQCDYGEMLKSFPIDRKLSGGGISATTNYLAAQAKGSFLLLMDHDDWIRPDMLYYYEKTLKLASDPLNTVLYCDEYKINECDQAIPNSELRKPSTPPFPYVFVNFICHCLLVPKTLWDKVGGCRSKCDFAQDFDLVLRLDLAGARFQNVPFLLYAWRVHSGSTAMNIDQKSDARHAGIKAMADYAQVKGLNWHMEHGYMPTTYRPVPVLNRTLSVHAILLVPNEKMPLLEAVKALLAQTEPKISITLVLKEEHSTFPKDFFKSLGCEILTTSAPFSYSSWNNFAVRNSQFQCETLLFVSPKVQLKDNALLEMCRWIHQPQIGMVGCRLEYPNGLLYHGGLEMSEQLPSATPWKQTDKNKPFEMLGFSRVLRVTDAVAQDCVLIKRSTFIEMNGFDENRFPRLGAKYLGLKLKEIKQFCFYTPFAVGIYHDTDKETVDLADEIENSRWFLHKTFPICQSR